MELDEYLDLHATAEPDYLHRIWRQTNVREMNGRMVSGHVQGRLLSILSHMVRPKRILELGTFTGYSALALAEGLEPDGYVDTIEIDDELEDVIRDNLALTELGQRIRLHIGDAADILPQLSGPYDLVFLDADKRRYLDDLELVLPLVRPGGFILADNTLWSGKVLEDRSSDDNRIRRDKQLMGIHEFNDAIVHDDRLEVVLLPMRDGLTLIRKQRK